MEVSEEGLESTQSSSMTVRGKELRLRTLLFPQSKLRFFVANPRIYTVVRQGGAEPTQDDIEERLSDMEHVRELISDIRSNGGLIEPLIVKPETHEVLEGNSRLAAYRILNKENGVKWALVRCSFLPFGLEEEFIFSLLSQYHLKGKKSWAPYEQAGFLFRRLSSQSLSLEALAKEIGLKTAEAKLFVETFSFMVAHEQTDQARWSYFYEYLKSTKIKKTREKFPDFDNLIVEKIQTGEIFKASQVRDLLPKLCDGPPTIIRRFATGGLDFESALSTLSDSGADNSVYKRLNRFRKWLAEDEVKKAIEVGTTEEKMKISFELDRIGSRSKVLWNKSSQ